MRRSEYAADGEFVPEPSSPQKREAPLVQAALAEGAPAPIQRAAMLDLQRAAGNSSTAGLVDDEEESAATVRSTIGSGGQGLDEDTKSFMESRLAADFSDVRVHTDSAAAQSAQRMNAHAYTVGSDIVFGEGRYQPDSDAGRKTLAHELTHVVQQRSGPVSGTPIGGGVQVSDPSDSFEQAAERSATDVVSNAGPSAATPIQREAGEEEEELQMLPAQREGVEEEEELQMLPAQREETEEAQDEEELAPS